MGLCPHKKRKTLGMNFDFRQNCERMQSKQADSGHNKNGKHRVERPGIWLWLPLKPRRGGITDDIISEELELVNVLDMRNR